MAYNLHALCLSTNWELRRYCDEVRGLLIRVRSHLTNSHVRQTSGNISETVRDREVVNNNKY